MAFVNSVTRGFISGASPGIYVSMVNTNVTATAANINVNIPSPQYFQIGMLRVKSNTPATGATLTVSGVWASDTNASNTTQMYAGSSALAYPMDLTFPHLMTDIKANVVIIGMHASVAGTVDIEFAGI